MAKGLESGKSERVELQNFLGAEIFCDVYGEYGAVFLLSRLGLWQCEWGGVSGITIPHSGLVRGFSPIPFSR
jgi:hypothetical protein